MRSQRARRSLVAVLALLGVGACKPLDDAMVAVFGRSMRDQRTFDPYELPMPAPENAFPFAVANYPAEEGPASIDQSFAVDLPRFTQADLGVPGVGTPVIQGLVNPIGPNDADALARGEELYNRYCIVCHGPDGVGSNANIAQFHPILPAYNISGDPAAGYSDQYLYALVRVGRGLMPEYGSRIGHLDRWKVVYYVRQLQAQAVN